MFRKIPRLLLLTLFFLFLIMPGCNSPDRDGAEDLQPLEEEDKAADPGEGDARPINDDMNTYPPLPCNQTEEGETKETPPQEAPFPGASFEHRVEMNINGVVHEDQDEGWWEDILED